MGSPADRQLNKYIGTQRLSHREEKDCRRDQLLCLFFRIVADLARIQDHLRIEGLFDATH